MLLNTAKAHACRSRGILLSSLTFFLANAASEPAPMVDPVAGAVNQLKSTNRAERKAAVTQLQEWVEKEPAAAKKILLMQLAQSTEPEIRERCLQLLKPIAVREFGNFGEGYMGISMGEATPTQVPGEAEPRCGLVISSITKDSPAQKAALQQGDVIIGLNQHQWKDPQSILDQRSGLSAKIRAVGAGKQAKVEVWRKEQLIQVEVLLTRRPGNIDQMEMQLMPNGAIRINEEELKKLVELEKNSDVYFKEWLTRQLAQEGAK